MMNVHGQYVIYHPRDLTFLVLMAKRCLSNRRWWRRLEKTNAPSSITECAESAWRESWNAFQEAKKYAETVTVSKNAGSHHIVRAGARKMPLTDADVYQCGKCGGTGKDDGLHCHTCHGKGRIPSLGLKYETTDMCSESKNPRQV